MRHQNLFCLNQHPFGTKQLRHDGVDRPRTLIAQLAVDHGELDVLELLRQRRAPCSFTNVNESTPGGKDHPSENDSFSIPIHSFSHPMRFWTPVSGWWTAALLRLVSVERVEGQEGFVREGDNRAWDWGLELFSQDTVFIQHPQRCCQNL